MSDPNLIVGLETRDDAGVYKLSDDLAIIQTIDFITPIVDDAYIFGQIAVANSLSDVYAMGGRPLTAMNLVCFPIKTMSISLLRDILRGGLDKMNEAGVTLVGGHSVEDNELKYGLSVTGVVHPQKVLTNAGAKEGDCLVLTKPLGTGILSTALKGGVASEEAMAEAVRQMATLNKVASELMQDVGAHACTDITGFGLLGHACQMAGASQVGLEIEAAAVPLLPRVVEYARMGLVPGGTFRNKEFCTPMLEPGPALPDFMLNILCDAQTSGGLLISILEKKCQELLEGLHKAGIDRAAVIGGVVGEPKGKIRVRWS